jgi:membrane-bound hydrogenase subunit beta
MLEKETAIQQAFASRFPHLADKFAITRVRRIFIDIQPNDFDKVFAFAVKESGAIILCSITGLDEGETLCAIYNLACENGIMINIKTHVPKQTPVLNTIIGTFPNADIYERELVDILGFSVNGLPEGKRYPLPDSWPAGQYPLRKDFDPAVLSGVKGEM